MALSRVPPGYNSLVVIIGPKFNHYKIVHDLERVGVLKFLGAHLSNDEDGTERSLPSAEGNTSRAESCGSR